MSLWLERDGRSVDSPQPGIDVYGFRGSSPPSVFLPLVSTQDTCTSDPRQLLVSSILPKTKESSQINIQYVPLFNARV